MSTASTPGYGRAFGLLSGAVFFGGQAFYFASVNDAFGGLLDEGIKPTIYGLAIVASAMAFGALVSAARVRAARAAIAAENRSTAGITSWSSPDDRNPTADAIIDRYLTERRTPPRKGPEHRGAPPQASHKPGRSARPAAKEFSRRAR